MANYSTELKKIGWQRKRLEILNERGWICEKCGARDVEAIIDVHHKKYLLINPLFAKKYFHNLQNNGSNNG